jgi:D-sedoheptulose 7-phosphate isomerase
MGSATKHRSHQFSVYAKELAGVFTDQILEQLSEATALIEDAYHTGKTVFIAGNGGSAGTASHMMADFQKTTLGKEIGISKRIKAIALSDNVALITAWGNDFGYDLIFAEQLRALAEPGDLLLVISASGNSPNIVAALEVANQMSVKTIGLLGFQGGIAKALCTASVVVESSNYGVIEDAHSVFMHMITADLREVVQKSR